MTRPEPPPSGHPGPRWEGDGSLGGAAAAPIEASPARAALDEVLGRFEAEPGRPYASFWRRLGAWLVDEAAKTTFWLVVMSMLVGVTGRTPSAPDPDSLDLLAVLPRLVLSAGYDWIFWTHGWTPGALLLRIRIVRADGEAPGPRRAATRTVSAILSSAAFFIGYVWMLRSKRRQTWHDLLAGTYVIVVPQERRP